ncbi:MAG: hypothetical protein B6U89_00460 [Desulfurococcales archaeon ex4484_58]|nr:MAG: hypothetical protein B6U89_00460 [Desulfurococcales archaeon ex4484_58]
MFKKAIFTLILLFLFISLISPIKPMVYGSGYSEFLLRDLLINKTILDTIYDLSNISDRLTGHNGYYNVTNYLYRRLYNLTNGNVLLDNYTIVVPVDNGSYLEVNGLYIKVYPIWPSGGVPVNGEYSGRIVVARKLEDLNSVDLRDSIVFIDMGIDWKWLWLLDPYIGVKAIIFYDSDDTINGRMYDKYLDAPVNLPLGYISCRELKVKYNSSLIDLNGTYGYLKLSSRWIETNAFNIIAYFPGENHDYKIVLLTHYDSWSPAIGYAPGANDLLAPAYLIGLAEKYSRDKPKYDTLIILFSGYYEGLVGHRYFVEKYLFNNNKLVFGNKSIKLDPDKTIYVGIDINSNSHYIAPTSIGYFYTAQAIGITYGPLNLYAGFIDEVYSSSIVKDRVAEIFGSGFGDKIRQLLLYSKDPNSWWVLFPGPYWLDTEPFWSSGLPAFTLKSAFAEKGFQATPRDLIDYVNFTNVAIQYRLVDVFLDILYSKKPDELAACISKGLSPGAPVRTSVSGRNEMFTKLIGQVMVWIPSLGQRVSLDRAGFDKALVMIRAGSRIKTTSPWNIRLVMFTDEKGYFEVSGLHSSRATSLEITALVLSDTGKVLALNAMGSVSRGSTVSINQPVLGSYQAPWEVWIVEYNGSISLNLVVDPITYQTPLEGGSIGYKIVRLDTLAEPEYYWVFLDETGFFIAYVDRLMEYSLVFGPEPVYYVIEDALPNHIYSLYDALDDTLSIVKERMDRLAEYRIVNPAVDEFLSRGLNALNNATEALLKHKYQEYRAYICMGLTATFNAYKLMKSTYLDVENTAILFSVLLVFFAFILGLYLRKPGDNPLKVVIKAISISVIIALIFALLHPAFHLTVNAIMSIIGFIMLILSIPALLILLSDFNNALKEIRRKKVGIHEVERSRIATSYVAFSYGVEHMKRRKLRTILTLITLIVVVISVVLFTSLSSYVAPKPIGITGYTPTRPSGFMFQRETIDRNLPLGDMVLDVVEVAISNETIARYWSSSSIYIFLYDDPTKYHSLEGVVGLEVFEDRITNISKYIVKGRWFDENDTYSIIIPYSTINTTNGAIDVNKTVVLAGVKFKVVGVYDDRRILGIRELDGHTITPVIGFPRAHALRVAFIPSKIVKEDPWMGKGVAFILAQISSRTRYDPYSISREIMFTLPSLDTYMYSTVRGVSKYSRLIALQGAGFNYIIAPVIIASISILGVMLGSIYERRREIYIYASLGLSPTQIGLMFIAEALACALIATVVGFSLGIVLTNIAAALMPQVFKPNYSSGYVLLALSTTFIAVLLASIYPVFKAGRMALPSLRRKWEYPTKPSGDEWLIPLPFKLTTFRELLGVYTYVYEYISGFTSPDIGSFVVEKLGVSRSEVGGKSVVVLEGEARLKPWHAGVKQVFQIRAVETKPGEWDISIYLKRLTGNRRIWIKSNKVFIDALRKQLLLWRTLHIEDKKSYIEKAHVFFKDMKLNI